MTVGERLAALEERLETKQAEYRTDIATLAAAMERRDKENIRWIAALVLGAALLVIAVLKF